MIIFKSSSSLSQFIFNQQTLSKKIGFVPTMGALHQGHLSLILQSKKENQLTVCSIFINPTQFNNADDLKHYPVTIESDIHNLLSVDCDILFLPSDNEIYPQHYTATKYPLGVLDQILEGRYRPGHFQGVCQVVDILLDAVHPDTLYLGQKDYQQCLVIAALLKLKNSGISLSVQPTIREVDGLAMSSRNRRLSETQRQTAGTIYSTLQFMKHHIDTIPISDIQKQAVDILTAAGFEVDYAEIANATTLLPARSKEEPLIGLVAASLNGIRLIDNLHLN